MSSVIVKGLQFELLSLCVRAADSAEEKGASELPGA